MLRLYWFLLSNNNGATVVVEPCADLSCLDGHPMRDPLFTLARLSGGRAAYYRLEYRKGEVVYQLGVFLKGSEVTLVNSYLDIPDSAFSSIVSAVVKHFRCVTRLHSQRTLVAYPGLICLPIEEYIADLRQGLNAYEADLSKKTRFNIRYYTKKLYEAVPGLVFRYVPLGGLTHQEFETFVSMVQRRYPGEYWSGFLDAEVFARFSKAITGTITHVGENIIAFNLFYANGAEWIFTGNSFDEAYAPFSLGFLTTFQSIRFAHDNGVERVILGGGDYGYKARLSNATRMIYECSN